METLIVPVGNFNYRNCSYGDVVQQFETNKQKTVILEELKSFDRCKTNYLQGWFSMPKEIE